MKNYKSDSETAKIEELKSELASVKHLLVNQNNQILKSVQAIQQSLSMKNNPIADQKIKREEKPSNKSCWNVDKVEGALEFGDDGLATVKGFHGLIRAVNSLPLREHGIVFFELKIIDVSFDCGFQFGISQKTTAMSSFYVFKPAYLYKRSAYYPEKHLVGCGIKFSAGKMFITWNGKLEKTVELTALKHGEGVDQKLTVNLFGKGCSVQLGRIKMSDDEDKCPF